LLAFLFVELRRTFRLGRRLGGTTAAHAKCIGQHADSGSKTKSPQDRLFFDLIYFGGGSRQGWTAKYAKMKAAKTSGLPSLSHISRVSRLFQYRDWQKEAWCSGLEVTKERACRWVCKSLSIILPRPNLAE
jgi:hypothetical protein